MNMTKEEKLAIMYPDEKRWTAHTKGIKSQSNRNENGTEKVPIKGEDQKKKLHRPNQNFLNSDEFD